MSNQTNHLFCQRCHYKHNAAIALSVARIETARFRCHKCSHINYLRDIFGELSEGEVRCPQCFSPQRLSLGQCASCGALFYERGINQVLLCAGCRRDLSLEGLELSAKFPCPHCEALLQFSASDPYRGSSGELAVVFCNCGGVMRWARGEAQFVPVNIWGSPSADFSRFLQPQVQTYQCEDCGRVADNG